MSDTQELDGMAALWAGVAEQRFPHTTDARVWVDEWLKTLAEHPGIAADKETMIAWFSNSIMAGVDAANMRGGKALAAAQEALQLIACPMRPDGTWNRDREACRALAQAALDATRSK